MIGSDWAIAGWYTLLTIGFIGYAAFSAMVYRQYGDKGSLYTAILFGSLALGTYCVSMARLHGPDSHVPLVAWFYVQRGSYVGALLGGWWLIDYRLMLRNGQGIPLRNLWRFWNIFRGGNDES